MCRETLQVHACSFLRGNFAFVLAVAAQALGVACFAVSWFCITWSS